MLVTSHSLVLLLLQPFVSGMIVRRTSVPVTIGFNEQTLNPSASGQLGIGASPISEGYKGMHWDRIAAVSTGPGLAILDTADGSKGFAVSAGSNAASFMTEYPGKTLRSFDPKSLYQACYLSLKTDETPLVKCTIQVTPLVVDRNSQQRAFDPPTWPCKFTPAGGVDISVTPAKLQKCDLPSTWTGVQALNFQIIEQPTLDKLEAALLNAALAPSVVGGLGSVGMAFDNIEMDQISI